MYYNEEKAQYRKEQKRSKEQQEMLDDAVRALLQHRNGRAYLWWLLEITQAIGVNAATGNALTTYFALGEQNIGQRILDHLLEVSPDGFIRLMKERQDERDEPDTAPDDTTG